MIQLYRPSATWPFVHRVLEVVLVTAISLVGIAAVWLIVMVHPVHGQDVTQEYLLSWIPSRCCVTNQCCWQISERELDPLPDDRWRVRSTGQELPRTDYSPDGRFYRCACDQDKTTFNWVRHQGAHTRCLFVPMRSARR